MDRVVGGVTGSKEGVTGSKEGVVQLSRGMKIVRQRDNLLTTHKRSTGVLKLPNRFVLLPPSSFVPCFKILAPYLPLLIERRLN